MDEYIEIVAYVMFAIVGLCVGSFLNVVIYRVPNKINLAFPASHCTTCSYTLKWYDNIPVVSYLMLGGKCRSCKQRISLRYMLVEIFNSLLWILSVFMFWDSTAVGRIYAITAAVVSSVLICIFFIDLEYMLIFNRFTIIVAVSGLSTMFTDSFTEWYDHLIGALAGGAVFLAIYFGAILILKREGLGFGDVKLAAAAGFMLGWQKLIFAMLIASVVGSIVLLLLKLIRKDEKNKEYPFGPFISAGVLFALFFGSLVINWYLGLILG